MRDFKKEQSSFEEGVERTLALVSELDRDDVDFGPAVSACLSVLIFEVLKHTQGQGHGVRHSPDVGRANAQPRMGHRK
jgi:hypothetical protein